ncbi:MAG: inositol monophosphatase, partial [Bacteroidota bacterium]
NARKILKIALKQSGEVLLQHFGEPIKSRKKESISSVVTEADLASERTIIDILSSGHESYNIISEESGYIDHGSDYTWVVDPLDGTSNFAAGIPWFGIIIALMHKNIPVLAAMYLPADDHLYMAESGKGAWKNGNPIHVTTSTELGEQLVVYSFDYSPDPEKTKSEMELMARLTSRVRNIRSTNSLYDFCYMTDARLGAAINQTTKIWDIAAPWLIIREAGGVVNDINGNEIIFDLSPGSFDRNYTIVASGAGIHQAIMKLIKN